MPRPVVALGILPLSLCLACNVSRSPESNPKFMPEQELTVTFGGFLQNGPEDQRLEGECSPNATRDLLQCDIHNGLLKWRIAEITFQVIRTSDKEDDRHYYRQRVSIEPLQTQSASFKLGMQLPSDTYLPTRDGPRKSLAHWDWLIVDAKGQRIE